MCCICPETSFITTITIEVHVEIQYEKRWRVITFPVSLNLSLKNNARAYIYRLMQTRESLGEFESLCEPEP